MRANGAKGGIGMERDPVSAAHGALVFTGCSTAQRQRRGRARD